MDELKGKKIEQFGDSLIVVKADRSGDPAIQTFEIPFDKKIANSQFR